MNYRILTAIITIFGFVIAPYCAEAAQIFIEKKSDPRSHEFVAHVVIEPDALPINVVEGALKVGVNTIVTRIDTSSSVLNLWTQFPVYSLSEHRILFAGGTQDSINPNSRSLLFTIYGKETVESPDGISVSNVNAYVNDGKGTKDQVRVGKSESGTYQKKNNSSISADIGKDESLFGGRYYMFIHGGDKGAGVDHFEVKEGLVGTYKTTGNFYILNSNEPSGIYFVKAINRDGTVVTRIVWGSNMFMFVLWCAVCVLLIVVIVRKYVHTKHEKALA